MNWSNHYAANCIKQWALLRIFFRDNDTCVFDTDETQYHHLISYLCKVKYLYFKKRMQFIVINSYQYLLVYSLLIVMMLLHYSVVVKAVSNWNESK